MKKAAPWLVLAAIVAFLAWKLHGSHFDWAGFGGTLRTANPWLIVAAVLVIYSNNLVRALRWALFIRPALKAAGLKAVPWTSLVGTQLIGFTGLAVFGRIGELIRPLLIARRTGLSVASQVAVLTVERVFDLGAFALIFAVNLLVSPELQGLPYLRKAGYTIFGLTLVLCLFVASIRFAGEFVARVMGRIAGAASAKAGQAFSEKILTFRDGLRVISTFAEFAAAAGLSVGLWLTVAAAYVLTIRAFPQPVHGLSVAQILVMMGFSVAGSALPVPSGSGAWAGNTFALANLFRIPAEMAAGAGLMVWLVGTVAVIPVGLVFARVEGVSLGKVAERSEMVERG